ncbi:AAA family ATPase [Paenibacillus oenotherae]|uniref:AAA family ATPase n=1 Tax=Paenibacillus oenotherae TaxID=1435645 RepID=A0ABS7D9N4_9BACL|nr:ATP-binding protein [Paenibacillus oenotherae]MBW7475883.1 AAA family ATPase [Paenibacillus oenotherae]
MQMQINISNFKSLADVEIKPGQVNVFIGANGTGKSALLEAIGVLSAAISEKVDDALLSSKGVRLGTPSLYKSSFKKQDRLPATIGFNVRWNNNKGSWDYKVHLSNPVEKPKPAWEYFSELLNNNDKKVFGRSRASTYKIDNLPEFEIDSYKGLYSFLQGIKNDTINEGANDLYELFKDYAIFTPNTTTLRGIQTDPFQREPVGLLGGRLSEAVDDLLDIEEETFGNLDLYDLLDLLQWTNAITIGKASKDIISPSVPVTSKTIRFTDRFMREGRNELTPYDASEGSLYVLFLLVLAIHKKTPNMFAIDNFDQALNPRLAREITKVFCDQIIENKKMAFITTHNPLVLDGLDLNDDRIRLFSVDRDIHGYTKINRILVNDKLLSEGQSLSRLWVMGMLGGVPNI